MTGGTHTYDVPGDPRERRGWIIYRLRLKHRSIEKFARSLGVTASAVLNALDRPAAPTEEAIARTLGIPSRILFPDRFDEDGRRLHDIRPRKRSRAPACAHVQSAGAAQS